MKENVITYIPLKIYRYLRWENEQHKVYSYNKTNFGREYADICASVDRAVWKKKPLEVQLNLQKKKDEYILGVLQPILDPVIRKYKEIYQLFDPSDVVREKDEKIWVFWWSGEKEAPEIVKACIKSIRRNSNGHEVIVLNKDNYTDYVDMPEYVLKKRNQGIISLANFSDILRLSLLATYGGVWIDATAFISQPIPERVFTDVFYTAKKVNFELLFYSKSRWCSYFLSGSKKFPLFVFARDCFLQYWEKSNALIDYLLIDYVLGIAYDNFAEIRKVFDSVEDNNSARGLLMEKINEEYSAQLFCDLSEKETFLSKLSWRYGNPRVLTADGKISNYGHLLEL